VRRNSGGSTYLEVLAATALFGIALVSSSGLLLQWHRTSELLESRAVAEHALAIEMDQVLLSVATLQPGTRSWLSGADAASGLEAAEGELLIERFEDTKLRRVVITLRWADGEAVRETLS